MSYLITTKNTAQIRRINLVKKVLLPWFHVFLITTKNTAEIRRVNCQKWLHQNFSFVYPVYFKTLYSTSLSWWSNYTDEQFLKWLTELTSSLFYTWLTTNATFHIKTLTLNITTSSTIALNQGILKGEVSLYRWPPVWLVWISLFRK